MTSYYVYGEYTLNNTVMVTGQPMKHINTYHKHTLLRDKIQPDIEIILKYRSVNARSGTSRKWRSSVIMIGQSIRSIAPLKLEIKVGERRVTK